MRGVLERIGRRDVLLVHRSAQLLERLERLASESAVSTESREDDLSLAGANVRGIVGDGAAQVIPGALEVAPQEMPESEIRLDDVGMAVQRVHAVDVALLGDREVEVARETGDAPGD